MIQIIKDVESVSDYLYKLNTSTSTTYLLYPNGKDKIKERII